MCSHSEQQEDRLVLSQVRSQTGMHHLSLILFLIAIDWLLKKTTDDCKRGIICPPPHLLENLDFADDLENIDFADDIALLSA